MKKMISHFTLAALMVFALGYQAHAQLQLPAPSPKAVLTQTVGLTDVTLDYSSPGVKDRQIWGGLVPHDQLWRAGANQATKVTFSRDVNISNTNVPQGTYSVFIIPARTGDWTFVLNKDANASTGSYKQADDVVRVRVQPQVIPHRERLLYTVGNFTETSATIDMEWEKVKLSVPVTFSTAQQAVTNINNFHNSVWRQYANAANYHFTVSKDNAEALTWINRSVELKDDWYNNWIKAQILSAQGKHKDAYTHAQKAKTLGDQSENFFFKTDVERALASWRKN